MHDFTRSKNKCADCGNDLFIMTNYPDDPDAEFCPKCQSLRGGEGDTTLSRDKTQFDRDVVAICRQLRTAHASVKRFLRTHDEDCRCDHCVNWPNNSADVVEDLQGIKWFIGVCESIVNCSVCGDLGDALDRYCEADDDEQADEDADIETDRPVIVAR
jgi:hypothetical protein